MENKDEKKVSGAKRSAEKEHNSPSSRPKLEEEPTSTAAKTNIEPMVPRLDPFAVPHASKKEYVVYLAIREDKDSSFTNGMAVCAQQCDPQIQTHCFQMDKTRHVTLWTGPLSFHQASTMKFTEKLPNEPLEILFSGLCNWKGGVYLQVEDDTEAELQNLLGKLNFLPLQGRKCDHLSLYRKRGAPNTAYREFARIRKAVASHDWGTVEGVSIRIKQLGTGYDHCRVLWSVE